MCVVCMCVCRRIQMFFGGVIVRDSILLRIIGRQIKIFSLVTQEMPIKVDLCGYRGVT